MIVREVSVQYRGGVPTGARVAGPQAFVAIAQRVVQDDAREHLLALYLDARHKPIGYSVVSVGTATASLVHPREVFQPAVLIGACAVIIGHNHPSGETDPSPEDDDVTRRLVAAGTTLGIKVLDHCIWNREGNHFSFQSRGMMP